MVLAEVLATVLAEVLATVLAEVLATVLAEVLAEALAKELLFATLLLEELLLLEDEELLLLAGIRLSSSSASADESKSIATFIFSIPVKPRGNTRDYSRLHIRGAYYYVLHYVTSCARAYALFINLCKIDP